MKDIVSTSICEVLVKELQTRIYEGVYKAGDRLPPERALLQEFNISRGSLREALKQLQMVGLLKIKQGSGIFVSEESAVQGMMEFFNSRLLVSRAEIVELMQVRKLIESECAFLAAKKATNNEIEELEKILQRMESMVNFPESFIKGDVAFHFQIAKMSRNSLFPKILDSIRSLLLNQQRAGLEIGGAIPRACKFHRKIYESVKSRHSRVSSQEMLAHLEDVEENLKIHMKNPRPIKVQEGGDKQDWKL